jgi:predicted nucleic acid-binding protein
VPYLLDSDRVIDLLTDDPKAMTLLNRLAANGLYTSIVTYMEAFQGTLREPNQATAEGKLEVLVRSAPVLPFSPSIARRCARLREHFRLAGRRTTSRALDLMIAATAIEHDLVLVTRNRRDYQDVPGLLLYRSG